MSALSGINLIGPASANVGQGVVLREYARALLAQGCPIAVLDLDAGGGRSGVDLSLQPYFAASAEALPHQLSLWVTGGQALPGFAKTICDSAAHQARFNMASVWWELPDFPAAWAQCAESFDAIVAGSPFLRESWANAVSGVPVFDGPVPVTMPQSVAPDRKRFELPADAALVYMGFDAGSDPVRKNPFAVVAAFKQAFPGNPDVRLVIKVNNPKVEGRLDTQMQRLYSLIDGDPRVMLIAERLTHADLLSLYASCDIVISLHRSEGLGLIPLEAMLLGKPVIATGWSGNMGYMHHGCAALVDHRLVPTDESATFYAPSVLGVNSRWAEPSVVHAANWLRALAGDRVLRERMGEAARERARAYVAEASQMQFLQEARSRLAHRRLAPPKDFAALRAVAKAELSRQALQSVPASRRPLVRLQQTLKSGYQRHVAWRFP